MLHPTSGLLGGPDMEHLKRPLSTEPLTQRRIYHPERFEEKFSSRRFARQGSLHMLHPTSGCSGGLQTEHVERPSSSDMPGEYDVRLSVARLSNSFATVASRATGWCTTLLWMRHLPRWMLSCVLCPFLRVIVLGRVRECTCCHCRGVLERVRNCSDFDGPSTSEQYRARLSPRTPDMAKSAPRPGPAEEEPRKQGHRTNLTLCG